MGTNKNNMSREEKKLIRKRVLFRPFRMNKEGNIRVYTNERDNRMRIRVE